MQITVMLGKNASSNKIEVEVSAPDILVSELLKEVRDALYTEKNLVAEAARILKSAERSGLVTFLSTTPDGPVRLEEVKTLRDYNLLNDCTLWLMCSTPKQDVQ